MTLPIQTQKVKFKFQEDIDFLRAQRDDGRRGAMIGIDRVTTAKENAIQLKKDKSVTNKTEMNETLCICEESDELSDGDDIQDEEYEVSVYHKRKCETTGGNNQKKKKIEIVSQNLASALDRTGTSDRNAMMILTPAIQSMGCKSDEVSLSRQTIRRRRLESREKLAKEIKFSTPDQLLEQNLTIHWDGKMLEDIAGNQSLNGFLS